MRVVDRSLSTFSIEMDDGAFPRSGSNTIFIDVDVKKVHQSWCTEVLWVSIKPITDSDVIASREYLAARHGPKPEELVIEMDFMLRVWRATCSVYAQLNDSSGTFVASSVQAERKVKSYNDVGSVNASFSVQSICSSGLDGPYTVAALVTCDGRTLIFEANAHVTDDYGSERLECAPRGLRPDLISPPLSSETTFVNVSSTGYLYGTSAKMKRCDSFAF